MTGLARPPSRRRRFVDRIEVRRELIVFALRERIEFVIVAAAAVEGQPHPDGAGRLDAVLHVIDARLLGDAAAFAIDHVVAMKAGGDELRRRRIRQQVAGELLDRELIERHVLVERVDRPVAPIPHRARRIALVAVGVRVARRVEPFPDHPLAIPRRGSSRSTACS